MAGVLIRRPYEDTGTQRRGKMSREDRGGYGSDTATYRGMPRAPEARREVWNGFSCRAARKNWPC